MADKRHLHGPNPFPAVGFPFWNPLPDDIDSQPIISSQNIWSRVWTHRSAAGRKYGGGGTMKEGLYIALCIILPVLWGILSAYIFDWWQMRLRGNDDAEPEMPPGRDMYYI